MTASTTNEPCGYRSNTYDVAVMEAELRKDKIKTKINFSRSRNNLLLKVRYNNSSSYYSEVLNACQHMDITIERAIEILSKLTQFYIENKELLKGNAVIEEMEKIEKDFYAAYEIALNYLDSRANDTSSALSVSQSINYERRNIINGDTENGIKTQEQITTDRALDKVVDFDQTGHYTPTKQNRSKHVENSEKAIQTTTISTCTPNDDLAGPSLGHDMWSQLKRIRIPVFSGDKRMYPSWKAAFLACIDKAPVTSEYKMLQLRQYVTGEALTAIENLGHSSSAYEAAKHRLERKYGGKRRQKAIFLDDIEQFQQVRAGNAEDLEHFADLLDLMIINLKEAGEDQDLGDGSFYIQLQRKLPQSLLAKYHRWLFENNVTESVEALKIWVTEESQFQIIASETVNGLTRQNISAKENESNRNSVEHKTFFINTRTSQHETSCQACTEKHRIWKCQVFLQKDTSERWAFAKRFKLCFRCLAEGHEGKSCRKTRRCGQNGCHKVHHRLLHVKTDETRVSEFTSAAESKLKLETEPLQKHKRLKASSSCYLTFGMEGKNFKGGHYTVENTILHSSSGIIDNWTEYPKAINNIDSRSLSTNPERPIRSDHVPKRHTVSMEGNRSNLPVREYKQ